jgi:superoxide reductase
MKMFVCGTCGQIEFNKAPEKCPVCGAPKTAYKEDANALKQPADPKNMTEGDKKHIPILTVKKQCGLIPTGCIDVHIKVGEILHVMEAKHWIMYIDVYLDYIWIARYFMAPDKVNPAVSVHLKSNTGKFTAIENCNVHGKWLGEVSL